MIPKRCLNCGKKMNQSTGECTDIKCPFKVPSPELQNEPKNEEKENNQIK